MRIEPLAIPFFLSSFLVCCDAPGPGNLYCSEIEKPNFVFIITEDIGCCLPMYGDSTIKTPTIESLAREGMVMANAYSTAGVCAPSRSSIITGMYPISIGTHHMRVKVKEGVLPVDEYSAVVPPEVKCFTEYLRADGYYCTNQGKRDFQFEKPISAFNDYGLEGSHWQNRPAGSPFFCIFNIFDTHESQVWMCEDHELLVSPKKVVVPPYYPDTPTVRHDIARSYSNIIEMDKKVDKILRALEKDNLLESTFVFFISDHGGPLPRQKREILDVGLHVPFIVRFPGAKYAGTRNDRLVSFVDLAPTFLSLANIPVPRHLQGRAFLGEQQAPPSKYIFGARDRMDAKYDRVRSVTDGRYVYVHNYFPGKSWYQDIEYRHQMPMMQELLEMHQHQELNRVQDIWFQPSKPAERLYDLKNDPHEIKDVSRHAENKDKLFELRHALDSFLNKVGDMGEIPEHEMVEKMWPGFQQPTTAKPEIRFEEGKAIIECPIKGASIVYQVKKDGSLPNVNEPNGWKLYNAPVHVEPGSHLHALAIKIGYKQSPLQSTIMNKLDKNEPN